MTFSEKHNFLKFPSFSTKMSKIYRKCSENDDFSEKVIHFCIVGHFCKFFSLKAQNLGGESTHFRTLKTFPWSWFREAIDVLKRKSNIFGQVIVLLKNFLVELLPAVWLYISFSRRESTAASAWDFRAIRVFQVRTPP